MNPLSRSAGLRLVVWLFLGAAAGVAPCVAAPRTIEDCEKIDAADAYNNCLASFGPTAREHKLSPNVPPGAGLVPRSRHRVHAAAAIEHGGGRQRMEFTIEPRHRR